MNDDDRRLAAWVAFCCLTGAAVIMLIVAGL